MYPRSKHKEETARGLEPIQTNMMEILQKQLTAKSKNFYKKSAS